MTDPSGGGVSGGALVPSVVKTFAEEDMTGVGSRIRQSIPPPPVEVVEDQGDESESGMGNHATTMEVKEAGDRDLHCPICMEMIKDAFLTMCGHNFCYGCISTHLNNKNDCPSCGHHLTTSNLYPNFLLNKVFLIFFLDSPFVFYSWTFNWDYFSSYTFTSESGVRIATSPSLVLL